MIETKRAIILLGLPLSGKSTLIAENKDVFKNYTVVSADSYKEEHEDYDPNNAHLLHEWSIEQAETQMNRLSDTVITKGKTHNIIMDGGGINNSYTVRIIEMLKDRGYRVTLVHVNTPLQVCLERNKVRARKVPEESIIDKAAKQIMQFNRLSNIVHKVEVVEYFTNKNIFVDMDGVIAALTTLPKVGGKIDFVNSEVFTHLKPVTVVIEKLLELKSRGYKLRILSATPNSFSFYEKNTWLDKYFDIRHEDRFFVNSGQHKAEMLANLATKFKLDKRDVTLVDDTHSTLYAVEALCMKPMHISEFLAFNFADLNK
jgi:predicted kinase